MQIQFVGSIYVMSCVQYYCPIRSFQWAASDGMGSLVVLTVQQYGVLHCVNAYLLYCWDIVSALQHWAASKALDSHIYPCHLN